MMIRWDHGKTIFAGDYIYYKDLNGSKSGYGVFVRFIEHKKFPLTKKKMLLKSTYTNRYWTIDCLKNCIFYKEHVPPNNDSKMQEIIKIVLSDS